MSAEWQSSHFNWVWPIFNNVTITAWKTTPYLIDCLLCPLFTMLKTDLVLSQRGTPSLIVQLYTLDNLGGTPVLMKVYIYPHISLWETIMQWYIIWLWYPIILKYIQLHSDTIIFNISLQFAKTTCISLVNLLVTLRIYFPWPTPCLLRNNRVRQV